MLMKRWVAGIMLGVGGGCLGGYYAFHKTIKRFENILDPKVATFRKPPQYIYTANTSTQEIKETRLWEAAEWDKQNEPFPYLRFWIERRIKGLAWRLLEIASDADTTYEKVRAIKLLMSLKLDDADLQQLAQRCNSETAAMLAREANIDARFFLTPPKRAESFDKTLLLDKFHDLFRVLKKKHQHWCLGYFISRVFRHSFFSYHGLQDFEYLAFDCVMSPLHITDDNIVNLCVEALLHHIMLKDNVHDMVEAKGLEILFDAHSFMNESFEIKLLAVKILLKVSSHPRYLKDLQTTGWLKVLVDWSTECDQRLSSPAASALYNLEQNIELASCFKSEVCLLHPLHRELKTPEVDVIIVHGLLGSAHSSWRQRNMEIPSDVPLSRIMANELDDISKVESYCVLSSSVINDIPKSILEGQEDDDVEEEYEFVLADLPVSETQTTSTDVYSVPGTDPRIKSLHCSCCRLKSQCWPKDWLPNDFSRLRILGVDYTSRITDWTNWCPFRFNEEKALLRERAKDIMKQLINCGVGDRPIVWIGHSMGGIIIKHMLNQSEKSMDERGQKLLFNTKSVFFLGTPHFGSPVAAIRKYLMALLPSAETKELELNSPNLLDLHNQFSKLVEAFDLEVVTFIETKGAKLTVPPLELELNCVAPTPGDVGTGIVYEIPVTHVDISKLNTRLSFVYFKILEAVKNAADSSLT